jgi:hypothetical protein
LGRARNASVNSILNALHSGMFFPPIRTAHALADRSRYTTVKAPSGDAAPQASSENTRPPAKVNIGSE